jgi:hypothetical protein
MGAYEPSDSEDGIMARMKFSEVTKQGRGYDEVELEIPLTAEQRAIIARVTGKNLSSLKLSSAELELITGTRRFMGKV